MSDTTQSVTFYSKTETVCPVCGESFRREEMMTGRGRLNAGELTEELRRLYIPSEKYGEVNPLIYYILVCPSCYFAASQFDFSELKESFAKKLLDSADDRIESVSELFPSADFNSPRGLVEGIA